MRKNELIKELSKLNSALIEIPEPAFVVKAKELEDERKETDR